MIQSHVKVECHVIKDWTLRREFVFVPALLVSKIQSDQCRGDQEGVELATAKHLNVPKGSIEVIVWDKYVPYNDKGEPITGQPFKVEEHMNGYSLTHVPTGRNHWLCDGVDVMSVDDDEAEFGSITLSPGTVGFIMAWTDSMNNNASETMEAYFPGTEEEDEECHSGPSPVET